eukprot:GFKZ01004926.1.p1 GENE.GFKZ01004926.1~~GFKZ01004926.1.p1  ORF type:complete len:374 (-),score=29.27 GFKZ01004926.1:244-1365(-)
MFPSTPSFTFARASPHVHVPLLQCTPTTLGPRRAPRTFVRVIPASPFKSLLQTAVTTYTCPHLTLHLHSMLHLADASYYSSLEQSLLPLSSSPSSAVLYELIAPSKLSTPQSAPLRTLPRLRASPSITKAACRLGAVAQADVLDNTRKQWYVADLPAEDVASMSDGPHGRRLALNPMLLIAALLPAPELFALAGYVSAEEIWALVRLMCVGNLRGARRLGYARGAVESTKRRVNTGADVVSRARDAEVFRTVRVVVERGVEEVALVYGAWHMGHLCRWAEDEMGMTWRGTKWRTVMEVDRETDMLAVVWAVFVVAGYVSVAGVDWVGLVEGVVRQVELGVGVDKVTENLAAYFVRHLVPYLVLRGWLNVDDGS